MHEKISRKDAKAMDLKYYFTGKKCTNGHIALRHVSSYCCIPCSAEWAAKERATNPEYLESQRKICRENNRKRHPKKVSRRTRIQSEG